MANLKRNERRSRKRLACCGAENGWHALLAALLILTAGSLWAGPLRNPKRLLGGYLVDLGPLFKWWSKHEGPRPLPAWVHVSGSIVGTNAVGWILEAEVEKTARSPQEERSSPGPHQIILKTPPVDDLIQFEELSSKLNALTAQRARLASAEKDAHSREQAVTGQQQATPRSGSRSRVLALEQRQLKKTESDVKAQERPLDQQIEELKAKLAGYPSRDRYQIDCFALDLQRDYEQLSIYEYGQVMK